MELNISYDITQTTTQVLKLCRPSKAKESSYDFITPVYYSLYRHMEQNKSPKH